jgi:hypothetical protein
MLLRDNCFCGDTKLHPHNTGKSKANFTSVMCREVTNYNLRSISSIACRGPELQRKDRRKDRQTEKREILALVYKHSVWG